MNYKKLTAVFMALGIAATCFSGCGLTEEWRNICFGTDQGGGHSSTEGYSYANSKSHSSTKTYESSCADRLRSQSGNTGNTSSEAEKEITYINGVLTDSDEDSVTIEYGSDGDFNQTTFDISNADIQIGENKKQGDL